MTNKIALIALTSLLLLSGCGDEKSTGERMAESVAKIRGGEVEKTPAPEISSEKVVEKTEAIDTKIQEAEEEIANETAQEANTTEVVKESLKEIANKAKKEIKELTQPAAEVVEDIKDVASIASESVKEVVNETKDVATSKLKEAKEAITDVITPAVDKAKEEASKQLSKVKEMLSPKE